MKMVRIKYALTAEVDVDLSSYTVRPTKDEPYRTMTEAEIIEVETQNLKNGEMTDIILENVKDEFISVEIVEVD